MSIVVKFLHFSFKYAIFQFWDLAQKKIAIDICRHHVESNKFFALIVLQSLLFCIFERFFIVISLKCRKLSQGLKSLRLESALYNSAYDDHFRIKVFESSLIQADPAAIMAREVAFTLKYRLTRSRTMPNQILIRIPRAIVTQ